MESVRGGINSGYVVSIPAILKYAEMVSSILTFAIAAGGGVIFHNYQGGGWVVFVGVLGLLVALGFYIMYLFGAYPDVLVTYMVEPITNGFISVLYLIAGIVAAVAATGNSKAGAASFFAFLSMVLFAIDAVIVFINNRTAAPRTTTTTTVTTNNAGVPPEYSQTVY